MRHLSSFLFFCAAACLPLSALAIDSSFTYQGSLADGGVAAAGSYDIEFRLQDAAGTQIGGTQLSDNVAVTAGVFTVLLDFGNAAFTGPDRFLLIGVRPGASIGAFTPLTPRTKVTPSPYAQLSDEANFAASVAGNSIGSAQIIDESITTADIAANTVGSADIVTSQIQTRVTGSCAAGSSINAITSNGTVSCEADDTGGAGDITSVTTGAGSGLSGGAASGDASLAIAADGVNSSRIANGSIGSADIDSSQVQSRITTACPAGQTIAGVSSAGVPTCSAPTLATFALDVPSATLQRTEAQACQSGSANTSAMGTSLLLPAGTYLVNLPLVASIDPLSGNINGFSVSSLGGIEIYLRRDSGGGPLAVGFLKMAAGSSASPQSSSFLSMESKTAVFTLAQPTSVHVFVIALLSGCGQVTATAGRQAVLLKIN